MPPKKPEPVVAEPVTEAPADPAANDEQPKEGRLAWTHIRNTAIRAFIALDEASGMIQWVAQTFELGDPRTDARAAVLTDLCVANQLLSQVRPFQICSRRYLSLLLLAKENGFSEEKLSTFFSIVWLLHENTIQKDWDSAAAYSWLKCTVMQHSVKSERGPPVFSAADVRVVTDFVIKGYIQHILLYKFCFTQPQPEDTCSVSLFVNEALSFAPLAAATSSKEHSGAVSGHQEAAGASQATASEPLDAASETVAADSADPMQDIIKKAVQTQVAALSQELSGRWDAKMQHLQQRLHSLEAK